MITQVVVDPTTPTVPPGKTDEIIDLVIKLSMDVSFDLENI
jgi:hypothetical protein